jgi:hypothetical protein
MRPAAAVRRFATANLKPLWTEIGNLMPEFPEPEAQPCHWTCSPSTTTTSSRSSTSRVARLSIWLAGEASPPRGEWREEREVLVVCKSLGRGAEVRRRRSGPASMSNTGPARHPCLAQQGPPLSRKTQRKHKFVQGDFFITTEELRFGAWVSGGAAARFTGEAAASSRQGRGLDPGRRRANVTERIIPLRPRSPDERAAAVGHPGGLGG